MLNDEMKTNRGWWNEAARVHYRGDWYQMKEFREGGIDSRLLPRAPVLSVGSAAGDGRRRRPPI